MKFIAQGQMSEVKKVVRRNIPSLLVAGIAAAGGVINSKEAIEKCITAMEQELINFNPTAIDEAKLLATYIASWMFSDYGVWPMLETPNDISQAVDAYSREIVLITDLLTRTNRAGEPDYSELLRTTLCMDRIYVRGLGQILTGIMGWAGLAVTYPNRPALEELVKHVRPIKWKSRRIYNQIPVSVHGAAVSG